MAKMAKILLIVFLFSLILISPAKAQSNLSGNVDFFWAKGCQYCEKGKTYLGELQKDNPNLKVEYLEITASPKNASSLADRIKGLDVQANKVPVIFIGQQVVVGFESKEKTGGMIINAIEHPNEKKVSNQSTCDINSTTCKVEKNTVKIPLLGEVDTAKYSLPILTIILGLADGFNPCAMWALVALLGILIAFNSQKRLIIVGGSFILFSYLIYLVFMAAWLNAFLVIGYIKIVQIIVGVLAIVMGLNYIRDFLRTDPLTCKVIKKEKKSSLMARAKLLINHNFLPVAIVGVFLLALAVNTIEALCSIGIPTIYTKALADAGVSTGARYGYLGAYNVFYMADDLIVFGVAVFSRKIIHPSPKIGYWARLFGGIAVIALGAIFIFRPELLSL